MERTGRAAAKMETATAGAAVGAERGLRRLERRVQSVTKRMSTLSAGARRLKSRLGRAGGALGIGGGFAATSLIRHIATVEMRMERMGVQTGSSRQAMRELREEIERVSTDNKIRVDTSELLAAVEAIVERTGDLDFARQHLDLWGQAIQRAGVHGADIGRLAAEARKFGVTDVNRMLNLLTVQGDTGSFTLRDLARQGPRLVSGMAGMGFQGIEAVREMGAIAQIAMTGTGERDTATTAVEALLRDLATPAKTRALFEDHGIYTRRVDNPEMYRPLSKIVMDMISAAAGDVEQLREMVGDEAARALTPLMTQTGRDDYARYLDVRGRGDELAAGAARIAETLSARAADTRNTVGAVTTDLTEGMQGLIGAVSGAAEALGGFSVAAMAAASLYVGGRGIGRAVRAARRAPPAPKPPAKAAPTPPAPKPPAKAAPTPPAPKPPAKAAPTPPAPKPPAKAAPTPPAPKPPAKAALPIRTGLSAVILGGASLAGGMRGSGEDLAATIGSVVVSTLAGAAAAPAGGIASIGTSIVGWEVGERLGRKIYRDLMSEDVPPPVPSRGQMGRRRSRGGASQENVPPPVPSRGQMGRRRSRSGASQEDVPPPVPSRGQMGRRRSRGGGVQIGPININSAATDPAAVAEEVIRRLEHERVVVDEVGTWDPSPEAAY